MLRALMPLKSVLSALEGWSAMTVDKDGAPFGPDKPR